MEFNSSVRGGFTLGSGSKKLKVLNPPLMYIASKIEIRPKLEAWFLKLNEEFSWVEITKIWQDSNATIAPTQSGDSCGL